MFDQIQLLLSVNISEIHAL